MTTNALIELRSLDDQRRIYVNINNICYIESVPKIQRAKVVYKDITRIHFLNHRDIDVLNNIDEVKALLKQVNYAIVVLGEQDRIMKHHGGEIL